MRFLPRCPARLFARCAMWTPVSVIGLLFLVALLSCVPTGRAGSPPASKEAMMPAQSSNAFACDLYHELAAEPGNLLFSPPSIHLAMAMAYAGADGETVTEMAAALYYAVPPREIASSLGQLVATLNQPRLTHQKEPAYQLSIANAMWVARDYPLKGGYADPLRETFGARLEEVNFAQSEAARQMINAWAAKETQDRIQDLIGPGAISALTRLILTNAVYFKSQWHSTFSEERTQPGPFHMTADEQVEAELMEQLDRFGYLETDQFQALEMPYVLRDLSMYVFLPREIGRLPELEQRISSEQLDAWLEQFSRTRVRVILPKFEFTNSFKLSDALQTLGIRNAFTPRRADFSGMTSAEDLFISEVLHKTFIAVDEEGTEAAAATAVLIEATGMPPAEPMPPKVFRADHPFLFLIRHRESGAILFMGRVTNPVG